MAAYRVPAGPGKLLQAFGQFRPKGWPCTAAD